MTRQEMAKTLVMAMPITQGRFLVKTRTGTASPPDEETRAWHGIIELRTVALDARARSDLGHRRGPTVGARLRRCESSRVTHVSGVGSWPGESAREAVVTVRDLLTDVDGLGLPYLPELPSRGPGSDIIGRSAALLADLAVDLQPSGWRFTDRPGRDQSRARSFWRQDLDELAEAYDGYAGPLKVQVAGPWTLAASIELNRGERSITDEGARRDLVASLAEGVRRHLAEVQRLVPGAVLTLQVDEPSVLSVAARRAPDRLRLRPRPCGRPRGGGATAYAGFVRRTTVTSSCTPATRPRPSTSSPRPG